VESEKNGLYVTYRLSEAEVSDFCRALRLLGESRLAEIDRVVQLYVKDRARMEPVDRNELVERVSRGEAVVLDVRPAEEYAAGHIAGAVSIPLRELESRLRELPSDREIVAYCRGPYCLFAVEAVERLRAHGYRASRLEDSVLDWGARGLPIERQP
jgi:rhodanese-related sulfurtransferase